MSKRKGNDDTINFSVAIIVCEAVDEDIAAFGFRIEVGPERRDAGKVISVQERCGG